MNSFFQKHQSESGLSLLLALITITLFGVIMAVSMRLVTDQFAGTNSVSQSRGRAQVIKELANLDCCMTLVNLVGDANIDSVYVDNKLNGIEELTCDQINDRISETYDDGLKATITPFKKSDYAGGLAIGEAQNTARPSDAPARDQGRYLGKWNYSVRCQALDGDQTSVEAPKYLKLLTWRLGKDSLTKEDFNLDSTDPDKSEFIHARLCSGHLNGSKRCD